MARLARTQKKSSLRWLLAVLLLLLLVWALWEIFDQAQPQRPVADAVAPDQLPPASSIPPRRVVAAPMPPPPTAADSGQVPVSVIVIAPEDYVGQPVAGTTRVAELLADTGFWIEQGGERMFTLIAQPGPNAAVALRPGQQVRLSGVVLDASMMGRADDALDAPTRAMLAAQPAFLLMDAGNVRVIRAPDR